MMKVRRSRKIPGLFQVKQARIVRQESGYFVVLSLQADVDIPDPMPHGHPVGIDVGLEYFLSICIIFDLHRDYVNCYN